MWNCTQFFFLNIVFYYDLNKYIFSKFYTCYSCSPISVLTQFFFEQKFLPRKWFYYDIIDVVF